MEEPTQERDACLLAMRQRTASETTQERETRHRRMRLSQQQHRASQTHHDTEARRQQDAEYHRRQTQINSAIPLLQQPGVRSKIKTFHMQLAALQVPKCITCLERFPGLTVRAISPISNETECLHCRQDKHIPKLYSSANNMNPGPLPPQLLVCFILAP